MLETPKQLTPQQQAVKDNIGNFMAGQLHPSEYSNPLSRQRQEFLDKVQADLEKQYQGKDLAAKMESVAADVDGYIIRTAQNGALTGGNPALFKQENQEQKGAVKSFVDNMFGKLGNMFGFLGNIVLFFVQLVGGGKIADWVSDKVSGKAPEEKARETLAAGAVTPLAAKPQYIGGHAFVLGQESTAYLYHAINDANNDFTKSGAVPPPPPPPKPVSALPEEQAQRAAIEGDKLRPSGITSTNPTVPTTITAEQERTLAALDKVLTRYFGEEAKETLPERARNLPGQIPELVANELDTIRAEQLANIMSAARANPQDPYAAVIKVIQEKTGLKPGEKVKSDLKAQVEAVLSMQASTKPQEVAEIPQIDSKFYAANGTLPHNRSDSIPIVTNPNGRTIS